MVDCKLNYAGKTVKMLKIVRNFIRKPLNFTTQFSSNGKNCVFLMVYLRIFYPIVPFLNLNNLVLLVKKNVFLMAHLRIF